ncbi:MAG: ABC transporter substrate-binding protein, partial [Methanophagales archaeon]|nr:ABC transporter substrate-binding protein [Methanophagales archaeon]
MRMKKILSCILVMVLLASTVPLAVTPAGAYEWKIPCDDGDNELTKAELVNAILPYMLEEEGVHTLDNVGDAAWVYAYWDGKQKTVADRSDSQTVTFYRPVERIITLSTNGFEALRTVDAADKIVGVDENLIRAPKIYVGEIGDLPCVSRDYELMLSLKPDLVEISSGSYSDVVADTLQSADPSIAILRLDFTNVMTRGALNHEIEDILSLGSALNREDEAEEFIDWRCEIIDSIKAKTDELSDDEKPRLIYGDLKTGGAAEWYTYNKKSARHETIEIAGGRNIAKDVDFGFGWGGGACGYVDFEWLLDQNPELIVRYYLPYRGGRMGIWYTYGIDDKTEIIAKR